MADQDEPRESEEQRLVLEKSGGVLSNSPWWLVSAGIHLVLLLGATLIAIEKLHAFDPDNVTVVIHTTASEPLISEIPKTVDKGPSGVPLDDKIESNLANDKIFFDPNALPS